VLRRTPFALLVAAFLLTSAAAGAAGHRKQAAGASARAQAISVIAPGQPGGATPAISAPGDQVQFSGGFAYGTDPTSGASIVTAGSANASVSASSGAVSQANASAEVSGLSIFNGEITASSIAAQAHADARAGAGNGNVNGSTVSGLVALGQAVAPGATVALADWGSLTAVAGGVSGSASAGYRGSVTALQIRISADHGGLPAGTTIVVGYAEVAAEAAPPPPVAKKPPPPKRTSTTEPGEKTTTAPAPEPTPGLPPVLEPPDITPKLTAGGYVFPVYGPSSFGDTFKAPRGDVSGGWHHGDDIFAPLGAPVLACASGVVFSVGWNPIGGNRLWLRDGQGNLFYYAHLSAFTPLAVNGNKVKAGDVLGFVGNTGDARGTPYHLHFEIHPVSLLYLGYDGVVNPTSYLNAWQHLQDVAFAGGEAWAPGRSLGNAPKPGAILLAANDISSADGLVPGSLQRAMSAPGAPTAGGDDFSPK
jgi:murein DD-endopeptidase MepM/ murein hydrolase activator NlpD